MKKAITTRYIPWTNTKPARIKATDGDNHSVYISADGDGSEIIEEHHRLAAVKLCEKMDWDHTHLVGGGTGKGYVWVWDDDGVRAKALREIAEVLSRHPDAATGNSVVHYAFHKAKTNAPKGP